MFLQAFLAQSAGYFGLMGLIYLVVWRWGEERFRGARIQPKRRFNRAQFVFEARHSLGTLAVGTGTAVVVSLLYAKGLTRLVANPGSLGWPAALAGLLGFLLYNDLWFYGCHRLLHHPRVYRYVHAVHHRSVDVGPFSVYSFHPVEALVIAAAVVPWVLLVPTCLPAIGIAQGVGLANNVMSHLGYEFLPRWFNAVPPFRWMNTSTFHNLHHTRVNGNFGLLLRLADRLFGTELPGYEKAFLERGAALRAGAPEARGGLPELSRLRPVTLRAGPSSKRNMRQTLATLAASAAAIGAVTPSPAAPERSGVVGPLQSRALVIVRVPAPWWAPRFVLTRKFIDTIPEYAAAPGLTHKAYTLSDDGRFGGVYLWESRAAAEAWFGEAWHRRVREKRGVDGDVRILDVRWTVEGEARAMGQTLPQHALRTDAVVTWLSSVAGIPAEHRERQLQALGAAHGLAPGLIRSSVVIAPDGAVGVVALWASRAAAKAFWSGDRQERLSRAVESEVGVTWFSAPVLLDAAAAKRDLALSLPAGAAEPAQASAPR